MTESFSVVGREPLAELRQDAPRHVLVTGAAGNIGSYFAAHAHQKYRLRLMVLDSDDTSAIKPYGEVVIGDIQSRGRRPSPLVCPSCRKIERRKIILQCFTSSDHGNAPVWSHQICH